MSTIAAIAGPGATEALDRRLRAMLGAMPSSAVSATEFRSASRRDPSARGFASGAITTAWARALHRDESALAARDTTTVVADATLYFREDLRRALGVADNSARSAAELILATYQRFGVEGFSRLEGDFAFVLWDGAGQRLVAARSFAGHRPLFYALAGEHLLIATQVRGVLADPAVSPEIDLAAVATVAAGLWGHSNRTAYRAIEELPAGYALLWEPGVEPRLSPFWHPPETILTRRQPIAAAAEELRTLLVDAVRERLAPSGPTGLSLSGGWDSTAVGGAATVALRDNPSRSLQPVSISYPEGDPGREDELIRDVLDFWKIDTAWLDVDAIPGMSDAKSQSASRDLPFAHAFENWNRALSRAARERGARVMLDGIGGDQLFQVSDIYLSDLFGSGRWIELARQWRERGGDGIRGFWRWAVRPALPDAITGFIARARRMPPPRHHLHREPSYWARWRFLESEGVLEREAAAQPSLPRSSRVLGETHAYLRFPFYPRIFGTLRAFAEEEGVEMRSPLIDERIVRFAARRPWSERIDRHETKIVLRRAMQGLLPAHVLAPRPRRTGITSAYFLRQLRGPGRPLVEGILKDPLLASLGMIDAPRFRHAWTQVLEHDDDELAARIFFTLQAELWMRTHMDVSPQGAA